MKSIVYKAVLLGFFYFAMQNQLHSQSANTGNWFSYFGNQAINKKWNVFNEIQYRNYNFIGDLQQIILRGGIGYNLSENNNNLLFGYAFIHTTKYKTNSDLKDTTDEHRIYQQFLTKQNFSRVFIQHRYRIEERFMAFNQFRTRFRYALIVNVPINNPTLIKNTFYISALNEVFLNGNVRNSASMFDQNRFYVGLGYMAGKNLKLELGYMAQNQEKTHRNQFQVLCFNNIPFPKRDETPKQ